MDLQPGLSAKDKVDCLLLLGCSSYERELRYDSLVDFWTEAQDLRSSLELDGRSVSRTPATAACNKRMKISGAEGGEGSTSESLFWTSFKISKNTKVSS